MKLIISFLSLFLLLTFFNQSKAQDIQDPDPIPEDENNREIVMEEEYFDNAFDIEVIGLMQELDENGFPTGYARLYLNVYHKGSDIHIAYDEGETIINMENRAETNIAIPLDDLNIEISLVKDLPSSPLDYEYLNDSYFTLLDAELSEIYVPEESNSNKLRSFLTIDSSGSMQSSDFNQLHLKMSHYLIDLLNNGDGLTMYNITSDSISVLRRACGRRSFF